MEIKNKEIAAGKAAVTVELDKTVWKAEQEKAFRKLSAKVSVPGFRPGKAPEALLRERVNPGSVIEEAVSASLTPAFAEVLKETGLEPFTRPAVNVTKVSNEELELKFDFVLVPTVELGEYKNLGVKKEEAKVTGEDVDKAIKEALEGNADLVAVEREAKEGDTVVLDFKGYTANEEGKEEAFEGGEAENYSLRLGSHTFVPGFEEALVGSKPEEEKDIEVTFPETYVKSLAGKKARFHCHIHEVKERRIPEANDESAKALGLKDVNTLEELKAYERGTIERRKENAAKDTFFDELLKKIREGSKFTVADEIYDNEARARLENFKKSIAQRGLTYEQYLEVTGSKEEDLLKAYREEGVRNIENMLVYAEIAKKENIKAEQSDIDREYEEIGRQYHLSAEEAKSQLKGREEDVVRSAETRKLLAFLEKENA